MGIRQNALSKGDPVVNSYFPQVRGEVWCGQFEPALAERAIAWPVAETSEDAPQ